MKIRDIKEELSLRKISTRDVFEKEELVQRLLQARKQAAGNETATIPQNSVDTNVLTSPLYFTFLQSQKIVTADKNDLLTITPSDTAFATVQLELLNIDNRNKYQPVKLHLLLDTACSGFVLRPTVVDKYRLPKYVSPASTMTGAAGTTSVAGISQLQRFTFAGQTFGPLPAAVQDIGALPPSLDGILGLSFLSQFSAMDLNLRNGTVSLFRTNPSPPKAAKTLASSEMFRLGSLGIFSTRVYLDGRGPVEMLVDTGASNSLLNWKGIQDLGLTRSDLSPLSRFGAMGSDNVAIELTHRLFVETVQLGEGDKTSRTSSLPGVSLSKRLGLDVGRIPILENPQCPGVGGILGMDILIQCGIARFSFQPPFQMALYE
jgi:predicted aspartyl protease